MERGQGSQAAGAHRAAEYPDLPRTGKIPPESLDGTGGLEGLEDAVRGGAHVRSSRIRWEVSINLDMRRKIATFGLRP
jgi:hypothetical protein